MVVDIGGGTVDITVHDKSNGKINVILPPMGNMWGGTTINEALSMLLGDIVEDKGFDSFIKSNPVSANATLNKLFYEEFEEQKRIFGDAIAGMQEIAITIPYNMKEFYGNNKLHEAKKLKIHYDPCRRCLIIYYL